MKAASKDRNSCSNIIRHLNRIQGQIDALKAYLEDQKSCEDVSHLVHSILSSFASVRASIVEEMMAKEFAGKRMGMDAMQRLHSVLALYKT